MKFDLGAFAGGAAEGYRKQSEDMRKQSEEKRKQDEADREEAYRKDLEAIPLPDAAYRSRLADYEKARRKAEIDASTTDTAARVVNNPIATQGIQMPASTFSEDAAQRGAENPMIPSNPMGLPSLIKKTGLDAGSAMRAEIAKPQQTAQPEAPAAPGFADNMDYINRRAAIDLKYGKLDGLGMMQLAQAKKQLEDEGVRDALLQIHSGNIQDGINAFNQYGKRRVKLIDSKQVEADVAGIKMPTTVVTIEDENGNRQTINAAQALNGFRKMENQLESAMRLMDFRQRGKHQAATEKYQQDSLADTRDYHRGMVKAAQTRADKSGGLTVPQLRTNEEITAAREYISGMTQAEIQRRTAQFSATGRENPDYDPMLASKVRLANHRMYGEDDGFADIASPPAAPQVDIGTRFASDPAMRGHRLGNKTPQGVEVLDANGKLLGHYN